MIKAQLVTTNIVQAAVCNTQKGISKIENIKTNENY